LNFECYSLRRLKVPYFLVAAIKSHHQKIWFKVKIRSVFEEVFGVSLGQKKKRIVLKPIRSSLYSKSKYLKRIDHILIVVQKLGIDFWVVNKKNFLKCSSATKQFFFRPLDRTSADIEKQWRDRVRTSPCLLPRSVSSAVVRNCSQSRFRPITRDLRDFMWIHHTPLA